MNKRAMTDAEIKSHLLEMLDFIDDFCRKNNLLYYLMFGTLIGAVRHNGFIPWDDDIDIVMPRKDYDVFLETFNDPKSNFAIISPENNDKYYVSFAKVYDKNTKLIEHVSKPVEIGVYIDIFPLDNCSDDKNTSQKMIYKSFKKKRILDIKNIRINRSRNLVKNFVLLALKTIYFFVPRKKIVKSINEYSKANKECCDTKYVSVLANVVFPNKILYERDWFGEPELLEFEGKLYYCPKSYKEILSYCYGDYMQLPPEEKRVSHHGFASYIL